MSFQLINFDRSFTDGYSITAGAEIENGEIVWLNASSVAYLHSGGSSPYPHGFAYSRRTNVYRPTDTSIPSGEKMEVIRGAGEVVAPASLFAEGSIPSVNAKVYAGANGLMTTTAGANQQIGRCVGHVSTLDFVGIGSETSEARIEFFFDPLR